QIEEPLSTLIALSQFLEVRYALCSVFFLLSASRFLFLPPCCTSCQVVCPSLFPCFLPSPHFPPPLPPPPPLPSPFSHALAPAFLLVLPHSLSKSQEIG
ncbi:unnamed protein product, partial [Closterium sp. NIES-54]